MGVARARCEPLAHLGMLVGCCMVCTYEMAKRRMMTVPAWPQAPVPVTLGQAPGRRRNR